jgi:hypothetical protein
MNKISDLRKQYVIEKNNGKERQFSFLNSIKSYCEYINMRIDGIITMISIVLHIQPDINEKWTDLRHPDPDEILFLRRIKDPKAEFSETELKYIKENYNK